MIKKQEVSLLSKFCYQLWKKTTRLLWNVIELTLRILNLYCLFASLSSGCFVARFGALSVCSVFLRWSAPSTCADHIEKPAAWYPLYSHSCSYYNSQTLTRNPLHIHHTNNYNHSFCLRQQLLRASSLGWQIQSPCHKFSSTKLNSSALCRNPDKHSGFLVSFFKKQACTLLHWLVIYCASDLASWMFPEDVMGHIVGRSATLPPGFSSLPAIG